MYQIEKAIRLMLPTYIQRLTKINARPVRDILHDRDGSPAVEFALIAPLLLILLLGIVQFGIAMNNYIELTEAVRTGGRNFAISRAISSATPYTTATTSISSSAPNLTAGSISTNVLVNGTSCSSDATCSNALTNGAGLTATIVATYPCNLTVMAINFAPGCTISTQTSDLVE